MIDGWLRDPTALWIRNRLRAAVTLCVACAGSALVIALGAFAAASVARAEDPAASPTIVEALTGGKVHIDLRLRYENADADGARESNAVTLRSRLGYGTQAYHGLSVFGEFENVVALADSYFDGVAPTNGRTTIADPEDTEVNQAFARYELGDLGFADASPLGASVTAGRKRITFDDQRFIGNVAWRQNEQTLDSVLLESSLGHEGLTASYAYVFHVNRIFGDNGARGAATRDFSSDSHLIHLRYEHAAWLQASGFAYLLDFDSQSLNATSAANSSRSFGVRVEGERSVGEELVVGYAGSFAHQVDGDRNPTDYSANYYHAEGSLGCERVGTLRLGYEELGSDAGMAQFRTPLATAHKFQGWADAFLDNGGPAGVRDIYLGFAPKLPLELRGVVTFHHFESDSTGTDLGYEFDAQLSRQFLERFSVLLKFAHYDGTAAGRADLQRLWLQLAFKY